MHAHHHENIKSHIKKYVQLGIIFFPPTFISLILNWIYFYVQQIQKVTKPLITEHAVNNEYSYNIQDILIILV
jgi:hypothetical protein